MAGGYLIGVGHDVALGSLVPFLQTPKGGVARPVRREYGAGNAVYDHGLYIPFVFEFIETEALYQLILEQFGLDSADESNVTVWALTPRMSYSRFNGVAYLPQIGEDGDWNNFFLRNMVVHVVDLEILVEP